MLDAGAVDPEWGLAETAPPYQPGRQPRLLDRVHSALRTRHMSRRECFLFQIFYIADRPRLRGAM